MVSTKKLFKFYYSELRCNRHITPFNEKSRLVLEAAKYADEMKHHKPRVRSIELRYKLSKHAHNNFINSLFEETV